jgi:hypothetical protein
LTDSLIKEILGYKVKSTTFKKVSEIFSEKYSMNILIYDITNIFDGTLKPIVCDDEYFFLFNVERPTKISGNRKYNDEHIYFIQDNIHLKTKQLIELFQNKFDFKISTTTISEIRTKKLESILEKKEIIKENPLVMKKEKISKLTKEQVYDIIKARSYLYDGINHYTSNDYADEYKKKYSFIQRTVIQSIWTCQSELDYPDLKETLEYQRMVKMKDIKRIKKYNYTFDEYRFVMRNKVSNSWGQLSKLYNDKFEKKITRQGIVLIFERKELWEK